MYDWQIAEARACEAVGRLVKAWGDLQNQLISQTLMCHTFLTLEDESHRSPDETETVWELQVQTWIRVHRSVTDDHTEHMALVQSTVSEMTSARRLRDRLVHGRFSVNAFNKDEHEVNCDVYEIDKPLEARHDMRQSTLQTYTFRVAEIIESAEVVQELASKIMALTGAARQIQQLL